MQIVAKVRTELGDEYLPEELADVSPPGGRRGGIPKSPDLSGLNVDFAGAKNLPERVLRIAQAMDGKNMNVSSVTRFLITSGQYDTTVKNFRSNVNRVFIEGDDYVKEGKGNFRYVAQRSSVEESS